MTTEPRLLVPVRHGSRGLALDVATTLSRLSITPSVERRRALRWLSAGAALALGACGGGSDDGSGESSSSSSAAGTAGTGTTGNTSTGNTTPGTTTGTTTGSTGSCSTIPTETQGPYPADGTSASGQRANALQLSGIVRNDIRTSLTGAGTTAQGVPLVLRLKLVDSSNGCAVLANRAIYLWHCDRAGGYSLYSSGITDLDYLRGVQVTDANGEVTFTTIFPACYSGRWPHIHFEIYSTLTAALDSGTVGDYAKVSQLALPADVCATVYNSADGYSSSVRNLQGISLASDNVFRDDSAAQQMATVTGSAASGYLASLTVGVQD